MDSTGVVRQVIARRGGGPGEVLLPTLMTRTAAGAIAIYDLGRPAIELYNCDGTSVGRLLTIIVVNALTRFCWNLCRADAIFRLSSGEILHVIRDGELKTTLFELYSSQGRD